MRCSVVFLAAALVAVVVSSTTAAAAPQGAHVAGNGVAARQQKQQLPGLSLGASTTKSLSSLLAEITAGDSLTEVGDTTEYLGALFKDPVKVEESNPFLAPDRAARNIYTTIDELRDRFMQLHGELTELGAQDNCGNIHRIAKMVVGVHQSYKAIALRLPKLNEVEEQAVAAYVQERLSPISHTVSQQVVAAMLECERSTQAYAGAVAGVHLVCSRIADLRLRMRDAAIDCVALQNIFHQFSDEVADFHRHADEHFAEMRRENFMSAEQSARIEISSSMAPAEREFYSTYHALWTRNCRIPFDVAIGVKEPVVYPHFRHRAPVAGPPAMEDAVDRAAAPASGGAVKASALTKKTTLKMRKSKLRNVVAAIKTVADVTASVEKQEVNNKSHKRLAAKVARRHARRVSKKQVLTTSAVSMSKKAKKMSRKDRRQIAARKAIASAFSAPNSKLFAVSEEAVNARGTAHTAKLFAVSEEAVNARGTAHTAKLFAMLDAAVAAAGAAGAAGGSSSSSNSTADAAATTPAAAPPPPTTFPAAYPRTARLLLFVGMVGTAVCAALFLWMGMGASSESLLHTVTFLFTAIAACSYFALYTGIGVSLVASDSAAGSSGAAATATAVAAAAAAPHAVLWARHFDLLLSVPLGVLALSLFARTEAPTALAMMGSSAIMAACWFLEASAIGDGKYAWWVIGILFLLVTVAQLLVQIQSSGVRLTAATVATLQLLTGLIVLVWVVYEVTFLLGSEGIQLLSFTTEVGLFVFADLIGKVGFGFFLLTSMEEASVASGEQGHLLPTSRYV